jgi:hypothetical protein
MPITMNSIKKTPENATHSAKSSAHWVNLRTIRFPQCFGGFSKGGTTSIFSAKGRAS